jgi:hypothetical protein
MQIQQGACLNAAFVKSEQHVVRHRRSPITSFPTASAIEISRSLTELDWIPRPKLLARRLGTRP